MSTSFQRSAFIWGVLTHLPKYDLLPILFFYFVAKFTFLRISIILMNSNCLSKLCTVFKQHIFSFYFVGDVFPESDFYLWIYLSKRSLEYAHCALNWYYELFNEKKTKKKQNCEFICSVFFCLSLVKIRFTTHVFIIILWFTEK